MSRRAALIAAAVVFVVAGAFFLLFVVPRWYTAKAPAAVTSTAPAPAAAERKITATLYYVSEDGLSLVGVKREVPFGEPVVEQARRIVEAQLAPADAPWLSPVPAGCWLAPFSARRCAAFTC